MRPELHLPAQGSAAPARAVVVDTNIVLDLLLFADPAVAPLRSLLAQQRLDRHRAHARRVGLRVALSAPAATHGRCRPGA
jgi:hypothetical protein